MAGQDPVLRWVGLAQAAEQATGVPADVLLGLIAVESGGRPGLTSSANAGGITQFIPGTAAHYGVNTSPGHERSQVFGAARYLVDLGFNDNPRLALKKYNAGPGNPQAAGTYDSKVLAAAQRYRGARQSTAAPAPASDPQTTAAADTGDTGDGLVSGERRSGLVRALTWVGLAVGGLVVLGMGVTRTAGGLR